jgi:hypothetical protein
MLHMDFTNCAGSQIKTSGHMTLEREATDTHISNVQIYNLISSKVH